MMKSRTEISGSSGSFLSIEACDLLDEVKTLKEDGWRFCQACADRLDDGIEIIYTFENTAKLLNLKMVVAEEQTVDSITFVFWTAFDAELDIARDCGVNSSMWQRSICTSFTMWLIFRIPQRGSMVIWRL